MSIPSWPISLPQALEVSGYSEEAPNLTISSQPDIGPAKVRRRSTAGIRPVSGTITLTKEELETLKAFFMSDLLGGALRFAWREPLDADKSVEMRFVDPPSWTCSEGLFLVVLSLEILP